MPWRADWRRTQEYAEDQRPYRNSERVAKCTSRNSPWSRPVCDCGSRVVDFARVAIVLMIVSIWSRSFWIQFLGELKAWRISNVHHKKSKLVNGLATWIHEIYRKSSMTVNLMSNAFVSDRRILKTMNRIFLNNYYTKQRWRNLGVCRIDFTKWLELKTQCLSLDFSGLSFSVPSWFHFYGG